MGIRYVGLYKAITGAKMELLVFCNGCRVHVLTPSCRTCGGFVMDITYVGLCQAVAVATNDMLVICNEYPVCGIISSNSRRGMLHKA